MKILRVFPRRTSHTPIDDLTFIGDPPMMRPAADEVHISVCFTWDRKYSERLEKAWRQYYPVVKTGGPAYDDPCLYFTPGRYIKQGVTFTSRGCNNQCPPCEAWRREGPLREDKNFPPGWIIQDNNLFQCSKDHIYKYSTSC